MIDPDSPCEARQHPSSAVHHTKPNIIISVRAAAEALDHLERSLRQAGFAESISAYERMGEVLLAQYLCCDPSDAELVADFGRLGETARHIFSLLHPYTLVMRSIATLVPDDDTGADSTVVAALRRRGSRGASASVLARTTGLAPGVIDAVLARLLDGKAIRARGVGSARSFMLIPAADQGSERRQPSVPVSRRRKPMRAARRRATNDDPPATRG